MESPFDLLGFTFNSQFSGQKKIVANHLNKNMGSRRNKFQRYEVQSPLKWTPQYSPLMQIKNLMRILGASLAPLQLCDPCVGAYGIRPPVKKYPYQFLKEHRWTSYLIAHEFIRGRQKQNLFTFHFPLFTKNSALSTQHSALILSSSRFRELGQEPYLPKRKRGIPYFDDDDPEPPRRGGGGWFCAGFLTAILAMLMFVAGLVFFSGAPLLDWVLGENTLEMRETAVTGRETALVNLALVLSDTPLPSPTLAPTITPTVRLPDTATPSAIPSQTATPEPSLTPEPTQTATSEITPTLPINSVFESGEFPAVVNLENVQCDELNTTFTLDFDEDFEYDFDEFIVTVEVEGENAVILDIIASSDAPSDAIINTILVVIGDPGEPLAQLSLNAILMSRWLEEFKRVWGSAKQEPITSFSVEWAATQSQPDLRFEIQTLHLTGGVFLIYEGSVAGTIFRDRKAVC